MKRSKQSKLLAVALMAAICSAGVTKAHADDGINLNGNTITLEADKYITNTIQTEAEGRQTAILAAGTSGINTGNYTLTVNSSGASGRNYIFNTVTNGTDFTFTGNLDATITGTGSSDNRGLRQNAQSTVHYNGSIKAAVQSENGNAIGIDVWEGSNAYFGGVLTDIATSASINSSNSLAVQSYNSNGAKVYLNAERTKLTAEGSQNAQGIIAYQGSVYLNGNADITAKNGTVTTRAINMNCDAGNPYDTIVSLKGSSVTLTALSEAGYSSAIGVLSSGAPAEFTSEVINLNVNALSDDNYAQGLVSQYGGSITLVEGSSTVVNAKSESNTAYGVVSQDGWGSPGHFTSHGNLTVNAEGAFSNAVYIYKDSSFIADQITAQAKASGQAVGAFIIDSTDVVLGSDGKTSSIKAASTEGEGAGLVVYKTANANSSAILKGIMSIEGSSSGIENYGELTNNADLTVKGGIYNKGIFTNSADMKLEDDVFSNAGTLVLNAIADKTSSFSGSIEGVLDESTKAQLGTLSKTGAGTASISGSIKNQDISVQEGTLQFADGTKLDGLKVSNIATSEFLSGSEVKGGKIINAAGANLNITGSAVFKDNTKITNQGTMTIADNSGAQFIGNSAQTGGAIENSGTLTVNDALFKENSAVTQGGAILNTGTNAKLYIYNSEFTDNALKAGSGEARGGGVIYNAAYLEAEGNTFSGNTAYKSDSQLKVFSSVLYNAGTAKLTNNTFSNNAGDYMGSVIQNNGTLTLTGNTFKENNKDREHKDGHVSVILTNGGTMNFTDNTFIENYGESTSSPKDEGIINLQGAAIATFNGTHLFQGNQATALGLNSYNNPTATFKAGGTNSFINNYAKKGAAISNFVVSHPANSGTVTFEDGTTNIFKGNEAVANGGAIYNEKTMTVLGEFTGNKAGADGGAIYNTNYSTGTESDFTLKDSVLTGNSAAGLGGAIYNAGNMSINAVNSDVTFTGNTDSTGANDIYNVGTLTVNAATDKTISLEGGITGSGAGTVNISGAGTVDIAGTLTGNTVNVNTGELKLSAGKEDGSNVSGVTVNSGAVINTIDGVINNYTSGITLADGAKIKLDADLTAGTVDAYKPATGSTVVISGLKLLSDIGDSALLTVGTDGTNPAGTINVDNLNVYTSSYKYKVYGSNDTDTLVTEAPGAGKIKVLNTGLGGLNTAVKDTNETVQQKVTYNVTFGTENYNSVVSEADGTVQKADFDIEGNGNTIKAVSSEATGIKIASDSTMNVNDVTFTNFTNADKEGALYNEGVLNLNNVKIGAENTAGGVVNNNTNAALNVNDGSIIAEIANKAGTVNISENAQVDSVVNDGTLNLKLIDYVDQAQDVNTMISNSTQTAVGNTNIDLQLSDHSSDSSDGVKWTLNNDLYQNTLTFTGDGHLTITQADNKSFTANIHNKMTGNTLIIDGIEQTGNVTNDAGAHMVLTGSSYTSGTITNNGLFDIYNGEFNLPTGVAQTGTTGVLNIGNGTDDTVVTSAGAITQQNLNILDKSSLKTASSNLVVTNPIVNNGTLVLNDTAGSTFNKSVTGTGTTEIAANSNVTISADEGLITSNLKLTSGTYKVTDANTDNTINVGALSLIANGGALSTQDGTLQSVNLGSVDTSKAALNVDLDLDWTGAGGADVLTGTLTDATKGISVKTLRLKNDAINSVTDILIADSSLGDSISVGSTTLLNNTAVSDVLLTKEYTALTGTNLHIQTNYTLEDAIQTAAGERAFSVGATDSIDNSAGALNMSGTALSITGQGSANTTITGAESTIDGINIANNQSLTVTGATISNFKNALNNEGTVNLSDVILTGNTTDVANNGTLNLDAVNSIDTLTGTGTANILSGTTSITSSAIQDLISVDTGATLNNAGTVTSALENKGTVSGSGNLVLTGESTNSGSITQASVTNSSGATFNNNGSITGTVNNLGTFNNSNTISGAITNQSGAIFTNSADLSATTIDNQSGATLNNLTGATVVLAGDTNNGTIVNDGTISDTGSGITNAGDFTNNATGSVGVVSNAGTFTNNGTTGNVTNDGTFVNSGVVANVINNANAQFTNNSSNIGTIANNGTFTNTANLASTSTVNNTSKFINSGTISGAITSSAGTVTNAESGTMSGDVTISAGTFDNAGTVTGATNTITNNGGTINNTGTISTTQALDNQSGQLVNAGTINSGITNQGDVINNGVIAGDVTNTNGTFDNSGVISGAFTNSVASANAVTNSGTISGDVTNTGIIETSGIISGNVHNNGGTIEVNGGVISGAVDSTSTGAINVNNSAAITGAMENQNVAVATGATFTPGINTLASATNNVVLAENSTLNTSNGTYNTIGSAISVEADKVANLDLDLNAVTGESDYFAQGVTGGKVLISKVNVDSPVPASGYNGFSVNLPETTGIAAANIADSTLQGTLLTPIRYLQGNITDALLSYAPTGGRNDYDSFNPAVVASEVAAQTGAYLAQLNNYDQAFANMDMYMLMTKAERQAMKFQNKYAAMDGDYVFNLSARQYDNKAAWFRPYSTFENVRLKNGPRVSNVMYGTFLGGDSELFELGNGWDGMFSAYAAYNGSHQAYQGNSIYQNGGTLGLTGMVYKNDFFAGLTANVGANVGDAKTMYGSEDFTMLMTGVAAKTGYNWELADGKFIIQPNYQMSYSFINTFDYNNAAGVRITSDPLHAITFEPGVKLIGNLSHGWQPYAGVSVIWNVLDKSNVKANDVSLPEMSVKPYVKYGVGVRKKWGERLTGFIQAFFTNGGRNGVGFQLGLRWALGKSEPSKAKKHSTAMPKKEKTNYTMKNV